MLPFDSYILPAAIAIAALFVYVFILRRLDQSADRSKPEMTAVKRIAEKSPNKTLSKNIRDRSLHKTTQGNPPPETGLPCMHKFGYLGTIPKSSKIPDECLGCSQIMKCLADKQSTG